MAVEKRGRRKERVAVALIESDRTLRVDAA